MSPHEQCAAAVAALVAALTLPGIQGVYTALTSNLANVLYPCVKVSVAGLAEEKEQIAFGVWLWTYPVLVLILFRGDPKDPSQEAPYMAWRSPIERALEECKALPGVDGFFTVEVQPGGNVTGSARARTEPGQTGDPLGPAWLRVAGALTARVQVIREV